jgi:HD-like signal output (HDOD) protein
MLLLEEEAELQDARVDALIDRAERLGMFPEMAAKVRDVANDNGASAQDLERVISKDAPLTAKVLRVANSPYYGGRRVVTTLRHALVVIGFREATQLALAFAMTAREGASESARRLQVHGAKTAVVARELARHTRTIEPAEAFVAGMLHDFGALALMEIYGLPYEQIYSAGGKDMLRSERELTGVDHAELGEACLMRWRFARSTSLSIRNHHRPLVYPGFDGRPTFTGGRPRQRRRLDHGTDPARVRRLRVGGSTPGPPDERPPRPDGRPHRGGPRLDHPRDVERVVTQAPRRIRMDDASIS